VSKHARAKTARVSVASVRGAVSLWVVDDGVGLPELGQDRGAGAHLGLALLRDNVVDMGGTLLVTDRQGGGVSAAVQLPRDAAG
jgi:nitrate/nitrite-specific signal transduction histidine kinase